MPYSDLSFRALSVLHKSRYLFNKYGFHNVGVDRIVREAEVPKASFYNYFHSKERLIEMCLNFQKDVLKEQVRSIIYIQKDLILREKLKEIFFLHTNLDGYYHLLFRAIFEIEKFYPTAYKVVVDYRNWLVTQIHQLLLTIKATATLEDAYMFLFVIDGTMVQLLSKDRIDERDKLLDYFLRMMS
ncbi:TetR/AcrR family transcriptional regulator [Acinetobacter baumannii]|uniref:TetR/AcrR family transcriptional regulator n=1 Tax=Acinetobacter baumannii TaxID=470 RepID=UPI001C4548B9|nr:TetR/AcrR family transcriptional regulator [Acinetobacter baumannii]MBV6577111.1 TetR/AcrR family transcriptional regulator [Acinetobacter baumannii]